MGNRVIQFPILRSATDFGREHRCHEVSSLMPAHSSPGPWRLRVVGREHHNSTVREGCGQGEVDSELQGGMTKWWELQCKIDTSSIKDEFISLLCLKGTT